MTIRAQITGHAISSRDMAVLLAVADEGSIRSAAQFMGVTPAAVSKTVRNIEARLGAPLFERTAGGMVTTEAARRLLKAGRRLLIQLSAAEADFRSRSGVLSGQVRIGTGPFPVASIARLLVPEAQRRMPEVRLTIELGTAKELLSALERGRLDLAICHLEDIALPAGFNAHVIQRLHSEILVRPSHPLAGRCAIPPAHLAGYGLACFPPYTRFVRWYRQQVGVEADFGFLGADFDLLAQAVAQSDMLLVTSRGLAGALGRTHALVRLDIDWPGFSHEVNLIQPDAPASPAVSAVGALMDETLRHMES